MQIITTQALLRLLLLPDVPLILFCHVQAHFWFFLPPSITITSPPSTIPAAVILLTGVQFTPKCNGPVKFSPFACESMDQMKQLVSAFCGVLWVHSHSAVYPGKSNLMPIARLGWLECWAPFSLFDRLIKFTSSSCELQKFSWTFPQGKQVKSAKDELACFHPRLESHLLIYKIKVD